MNIKEEILSRMVSYLSEDWIDRGIVEVYNKSYGILKRAMNCGEIRDYGVNVNHDLITFTIGEYQPLEFYTISIEDIKTHKKKLKRT